MRRLLVAALLACAACQPAAPSRPVLSTRSVTYEVTDRSGTHREVVEVDRPFRARLRVYDGSTVTGGFAWTESGVFTLKPSGAERSQDVPASRPGPDSYLDVALPEGVRAGQVRQDGTGTFAGAPCSWYVSRLPLESGTWSPPAGGDETRSCVAADGLVLATRETIDGVLAVQRTATSVTRTGRLTDQVLFGGPAPTGGLGVLKVRALTEPPTPALAVPAVSPGAGWVFRAGAVVATVPPGKAATANGDRAVWAKDLQLAVLAEDQQLDSPTALPTRGELVDGGRLSLGYDGLTWRALTTRGILLTLTGHLTREEILAWAASLQRS